jgi:hypothetical protein
MVLEPLLGRRHVSTLLLGHHQVSKIHTGGELYSGGGNMYWPITLNNEISLNPAMNQYMLPPPLYIVLLLSVSSRPDDVPVKGSKHVVCPVKALIPY